MPSRTPPALPIRPGVRIITGGGTTGNELLTTAAGALLIVLLAVIGVTIVRIGPLLSVHMFVGMLLLGPIALKLASTGYRFARYYTRDPRYRAEGPPPAPLRLIAPIVVLTTIVVMASGVALLLGGPQSRGTFFTIHKLSFIVWVAFTSLHVLGHIPDLWAGLQADYGSAARLGHAPTGRAGRMIALVSALTLGLVLALVSQPLFGPWLSAHLHRH